MNAWEYVIENDNLKASDLNPNSHNSSISQKEGTGDFTPPQNDSNLID